VAHEGTDEVAAVALAFNEMADQLQAAETLRRNLMADVAHELRTPLSVLQGNLRAILDDVYPLDKSEVTRLYTQSRLLSRLVNDLHELAQAEAGQLSLNLTPTDLRPLLRETIEIFTPMAEDDAITLQAQLATTLPAVPVDAVRLRQVLHNLLANALRHTPAGGTVTVASAATAAALTITIRDSGEGIAPEHLPHLFDRFYRADRARARDTGGAGLGLAIVRAIVQAHGGTVTAHSAGMGQGSTFVVTLPLVQ
jgi:signal transduction histidine kinase